MSTRNSRDGVLRAIADDLRRSRDTITKLTPEPRLAQVQVILTEAIALLEEAARSGAGRVEYFTAADTQRDRRSTRR